MLLSVVLLSGRGEVRLREGQTMGTEVRGKNKVERVHGGGAEDREECHWAKGRKLQAHQWWRANERRVYVKDVV